MRPFLGIFFLCWFITLFLPWWSVLIPALFLGAWLFEKSAHAFLIGFIAAGMAWFVQAFYIHIANDAILSTRIAETISVGSPWVLLLITFIIGGLLGGFGTLLGVQSKHVLRSTDNPQST